MPGHLVQPAPHVGSKLVPASVAHAAQAGTNTAAGFGNLFVARSCDTLLEVNESGRGEDRMGVGVDEPRQHDLARAIDLLNMCCFRREEFVLRNFVGCPNRDNLAVSKEHRAVCYEPEFAHLRAPARAGVARFAAQGQQLRRVGEEHCTAARSSGFGVRGRSQDQVP